MSRMAPSLTSVDCLRLQRYVTLPGILAAARSRPIRRFWPYLVRKQSAATTIKFFLGLRKKYGPSRLVVVSLSPHPARARWRWHQRSARVP